MIGKPKEPRNNANRKQKKPTPKPVVHKQTPGPIIAHQHVHEQKFVPVFQHVPIYQHVPIHQHVPKQPLNHGVTQPPGPGRQKTNGVNGKPVKPGQIINIPIVVGQIGTGPKQPLPQFRIAANQSMQPVQLVQLVQPLQPLQPLKPLHPTIPIQPNRKLPPNKQGAARRRL